MPQHAEKERGLEGGEDEDRQEMWASAQAAHGEGTSREQHKRFGLTC